MVQDSNLMETGWMKASASQGIPQSFVVNEEGRLAWIGHPKDLVEVLPKIVNKTWNIKEALDKKASDRRLTKLDLDASAELEQYAGNAYREDIGKPDSALLMINKIIRKEPALKYAPRLAYHTFSALLKTNPHQAYEYGKVLIATPTYEDPAYDAIILFLGLYADKLSIPAEIYHLGAEAYQEEIDKIPYPEIINMPRLYTSMAEWYARANDQPKAIEAQQKAIEELKSRNAAELAVFESKLQQYKKP